MLDGMYYLNGTVPVKCLCEADAKKALKLCGNIEEKRLAITRLNENIKISTVFLIYDHSFNGEDKPVLFETIVFAKNDEDINELMERYTNWDDAIHGHEKMVKYVRNHLKQKG